MIVGLTGSIAMGKSTTAEMFTRLGYPVFDADKAVHQLYQKGGEAAKKIAKHWPDVILDGAVNRQMLATKISQDPSVLPRLEKIVHPLVHNMEQQFISDQVKAGTSLIIFDIPLLFEAGRDQDVDVIVVVTTTKEIQKIRVLKRPGMTQEKLDLILSRQLPDEEKRAKADHIIDTSVSMQDTFEQIKRLAEKLVSLEERTKH